MPAEDLAEEAGDERQRQEDRRQDRELLDGAVLVETGIGLPGRVEGWIAKAKELTAEEV